MNEVDLKMHLDFVDGVQKAHMLVLRAFLIDQPEVREKINRYAEQLARNPPADGLSKEQLHAMQTTLLQLTQ